MKIFMLIPLVSMLQLSTPAFPEVVDQPSAVVRIDDLSLLGKAGEVALRGRIDQTVVALSGSERVLPGTMLPRPDLVAARRRGQDQATALILAARQAAKTPG